MIGKKTIWKKTPTKQIKKTKQNKTKESSEKKIQNPFAKKIHTHPKLKINEEKSKTRLSLFFFTVIIY